MLPTRPFQQNSLSHGNIEATSPQLASIISYPMFDKIGYVERVSEIQELGVKFVICGGRSMIGNLAIAGKGCVSLVLRAKSRNNDVYALKVRRIDANRSNMEREVELHKIANSVGVGPKILGYSKNIILMEFVEGLSIIDWIARDDNATDPKIVLSVVLEILEQCYLLDTIHLDHGQLSYLAHHVIISNSHKATLIDFESSSTRRKASNVTCAAQSLLLSGFISTRINDVLFLQNKKERLIKILQLYKSCQTRASFDELLQLLLG